jgi:predicted phage tail protein
VDLLIAKLTPKKAIEKQLKVYDRIMERRAKHIESHPDDLTEIQKLKEDVAKVDDLGAPTATFEKHLETLEAVKAKLEAKNITTTGIQNAIDNANELLEKKGLGNTNKNQNSGTVFGTQKK